MEFDTIIDRRGTDSLKHDCAERRGYPAGILPMWVADMDFAAPKAVRDALAARSQHGIYGYSECGNEYFDAVASWYQRRFGYTLQPKWLVKTPGVVFAISTAIQAFTAKGDGVLIQEPVYYPFRESIELNNRRVVVNQLVLQNGRYEIDFADFEEKIRREGVKLFILCSPHNPVGRVWAEDELRRMGEICLANGVLVVSDEIHADLVLSQTRHHVFPSLEERFAQNTILCTAPSKTFNLAGLQASNIFIPNPELRRVFIQGVAKNGYSQLNAMGLLATRVAYEEGEAWLENLLRYLRGNLQYMKEEFFNKAPGVQLVEPEGTYLLWMDFRSLGLAPEELDKRIEQRGNLWLDGGTMFGQGGAGFQRINIACPRATLAKACEGLLKVL